MKAVYFLQIIVFAGLLCSCKQSVEKAESFPFYHSLTFDKLPEVWDEAIPLGNGLTGALIWQKEGRLRIAIDRADLWDLRPVEPVSYTHLSFRSARMANSRSWLIEVPSLFVKMCIRDRFLSVCELSV